MIIQSKSIEVDHQPTVSTPWKHYGEDGLYVDVNMRQCGFRSDLTPIVTTVLAGESHHWTTTGGSEVYHLKSTGFR